MPVRILLSSVPWYCAEPLTHMLVTILTPLSLVSKLRFSRSFNHLGIRPLKPQLSTSLTRLEQALCQTECHNDNRYRLRLGLKTANASAIWSHNATYTGYFHGSGDDVSVVKYGSDN